LKLFIILVALAAAGGAGVWGFAQSTEVRGDTAMPAELHAVPAAGAVPSAQDLAGYLGGLRAGDYTRYTHPRYGFSFTYPKEFILGTVTWREEDVTDLWLAPYRLGIRVTVRPIGKHTYTMWFAHEDQLYTIRLHTPDIDVLEAWARGFVSSSFSLPSQ
jgi:hypothetical protein